MDVITKIQQKKSVVSIIGLGYVGLPLAVAIAKEGYQVIGIDKERDKIDALYNRRSYVSDVSNEMIQEVIGNTLQATFQYEYIKRSDIIMICVPTPLDEAKEPDLSCIQSSVDEIIKYIKEGTLIIAESTVYPGATYELIVQRVEQAKNWKVGEDFFVCFSPERVDPNNSQYGVVNTPKVVGGSTPRCLEMGKVFYSSFLKWVYPVSSMEVAETSKLLENTFRCINIGFINEMTIMCEKMGINIWEAIDAAATKPFGFMKFTPGPGIGGHCIPIDPLYLSWKGKKSNYFNRFVELASDVNTNMPRYVVHQIQDILNKQGKCIKDTKLLLMGAAYKKDISDVRESPFLEVYKELTDKEAILYYHDPYVPSVQMDSVIQSQELSEELIEEMDMVIILVGHSNIDYKWVAEHSKVVYDTRNVGIQDEQNVVLLGDNI